MVEGLRDTLSVVTVRSASRDASAKEAVATAFVSATRGIQAVATESVSEKVIRDRLGSRGSGPFGCTTTPGGCGGCSVPSSTSTQRTGETIVGPRARVLSATVRRRADRWYVCLNLEAADYHRRLRHQQGQAGDRRFVGIDRGLAAFAVVADSDGVEVCRFSAPQPLARRRGRLRRRSRALSRTQRGSRNRMKAIRSLAREHNRIANIRRNFLHEVSSQLAKTHSALAVEDLPWPT